MAYLDSTTGANFIPELWAEPVFKFYERKLKLKNSIDDYSALVGDAGDTVHIPKIQMDGTNDKAASTAVTFSVAGTEGKVDLAIDKHKYLANIFEDIVTIQSNSELLVKYTKMMGESLARGVETDIWAELDGLQTNQDLAGDNTMAVGDLETLLANLYGNDLDPNDCSLAVNSILMGDIMNPSSGIASYFIRQDAIGGNGTELKTGAVGLIYGMDVFYSRAIATALTDGTIVGAAYASDACVFAAQRDVRVQSQYDVEFLGTKVVVDMIYGVKLLDESGDIRGINLVNP